LRWLLQYVHENDPSLFKDQEHKKAFKRLIKEDKDTFLFVNSPFENIKDEKISKIFYGARSAIQGFEYRLIHYHCHEEEKLIAKCLKLIYMNNNWYLAVEHHKGEIRLLRLAFITSIGYATKSAFQPSKVEHYQKYFDKIQNPFTINAPISIAQLRASADISVYFKEGMKPFFPSQKIVEQNEDGSIVFTVEYTQTLEILPFIKQWLPQIEILSPDSLKTHFKEDLRKALDNIKE
jgi:predicted DNA-binding transcriptional regulator YafY